MTIEGLSYSDQSPIKISFDERIQSIVSAKNPATEFFIGPGFIDLQVNGFGGIDYNQLYPDPLELTKITELLFAEGVTTHLPTVITNAPGQMEKLIRQLVMLREQHRHARWSIEGLHIEGPFISPEDGPRGAHPKEHVRPPDIELMLRWQEAAEGLIKIVTLSPEWENANSFIEQCVKRDIVVSIGHTRATHQQIQDAVKAGATLSTHLGNGMHPQVVRHPNYLWSQLANDGLSPSIIADGFHLPPEVIKVFLKVKQDKIFLVSDSVSLAGMPAGDYDLHIGGQVTLTKEGKLHLRNNPAIFAGSASSLRQGISFLLRNGLATLSRAWEMASHQPNKILFPSREIFQRSAPADVVILDQLGNQIKVVQTFKNGIEVFRASDATP